MNEALTDKFQLKAGPIKPAERVNGKFLEDNRPQSTIQKKANNTGLPNQLKSGIENLSGHSMDDVKVHYNSSKPAQLNAHAYAQGTDIHIASGQEKHLPHEAWHVVQQKQGRVRPTMQLKAKVKINDDKSLEKEADVMGAKALQRKVVESNSTTLTKKKDQIAVVQRTVLSKVYDLRGGGTKIVYYSTYDPKKEFDDQFEAWDHDTKLALKQRGKFDEYQRYPTNFTHYNTQSRNIPLNTGKAGPHTISHSSLSFRLSKQINEKGKKLKHLRDEQVPSPKEFLHLLYTEVPSTMKFNQIQRYVEDYKILYERLDKIIQGGKEHYKNEGHELLMRLIQLHPYTTYGKGKKVSQSRIKAKNESREDKFEDAFDKFAKFNSKENYAGFKRKRKSLYEESEDSEEESKEIKIKKLKDSDELKKEDLSQKKKSTNVKEIKKSKDKEESEEEEEGVLSPLDVMILLGRTHRGALYIFNKDDWNACNEYKKEHPNNKYSR